MSTATQYWFAVAVGMAIGLAACAAARRLAGRTAVTVGRAISIMLAADAVTFVVRPIAEGTWAARSSLPLNLCDIALVIAAIACWLPRWQLGVELTYFWGLAGTLQAVVTPDLSASFPHLDFFEFVAAHVGIVIAALYLVVSLRREPRRGSVTRVFVITIAYTALVGVIDWLVGGNYMYLSRVPSHTSLLSALGSWPWYIVSAAGVALVLLNLLYAPFRYRAPARHPTSVP